MDKAKCRFVLDENSLMLDRVPAGEREAEIESLIDELQALHEGGERVDILSGWGGVAQLLGRGGMWQIYLLTVTSSTVTAHHSCFVCSDVAALGMKTPTQSLMMR